MEHRTETVKQTLQVFAVIWSRCVYQWMKKFNTIDLYHIIFPLVLLLCNSVRVYHMLILLVIYFRIK
jgi:hypothetical protein